MSDDFDDLDWLNDDGDSDGSSSDDDDLSLDWLQSDDDDNRTAPEDKLGVTGELDWLRASGDDDSGVSRDDNLGVTGELDWMQSQDEGVPTSGADRTGVTGELSWLGDDSDSSIEDELDFAEAEGLFGVPDDEPQQSELSQPRSLLDNLDDSVSTDSGDDGNDFASDLPPWMSELPEAQDDFAFSDEMPAVTPPSTSDENEPIASGGSDLPPWMSDIEPDDLDSVDDDVLQEEVPEWMQDSAPAEAIIEDEPSEEAPAWMSDTGVLAGGDDESEEAPAWMSDTGVLAGGDDESEEAPAWMSDTGVLAGGDDESEEAPAWMSDTGVLAGGDDESEEAPAWMSGTGELADAQAEEVAGSTSQDLPDWLSTSDTSDFEKQTSAPVTEVEDSVDDGAVPDWLQGGGDDNAFTPSEPIEPEAVADDGDAVPDWLSTSDEAQQPVAQSAPLDSHDDNVDTGDLPPWMVDSEFEDQLGDSSLVESYGKQEPAEPETTMDWMSEEEGTYESDELNDLFDESEEVPDWLASSAPESETQQEESPDFDNLFGDDDFSTEEPVVEAEDDFDLFGELTAEGSGTGVTGLLGGGDDDDFDLLGEMTDDDTFADLLGDDQANEDDIFAGISESSDNEDDIFAQFDDDLSDDDIFSSAGVDDELDGLFGDAESAVASDDLASLFGDDESDELAPADAGASNDDFDPDTFFADVTPNTQEDEFAGLFDDADSNDMVIEEDVDVFSDEQLAVENSVTGDLNDLFASFDDAEPENPLEATMQDDLASILGRDDVPVDSVSEDDFASLFGDSGDESEQIGDYDEIDSQDIFFGEKAEQQQAEVAFDPNMFGGDDSDDSDAEFDLDNFDSENDRIDWFTDEVQSQQIQQPSPDDLSWLSDIEEDSIQLDAFEQQEQAKEEEAYANVEDFLSTLEDNAPLPQTGELSLAPADVNFDQLFEGSQFDDIEDEEEELDESASFNPDAPEWLTDAGFSVSGTSAASIVRGQQDRSLDELPDALRALHDRATVEKPASQPTRTETEALPGVKNPLTPVTIPTVTPSMDVTLQLSNAQHANALILRSITGVEDEALTDIKAQEAQKTRRLPQVAGLRVDRMVITLILAVLVALPFFTDALNVGQLPPPVFEPETPQMAFFQSVNSLQSGDYVLVAIEYGPTSAAELDSGTDALLRHILARGAVPIIVGGNPTGLLHVRDLMTVIVGDDDVLVPNRDYVVGRYLIADALGVRAFSENVGFMVSTDLQGSETGLEIGSLDEFSLIVVVAERADAVRNWAEQVAPNTNTAMTMITSQSAGPLAEPYIQSVARGASEIGGLLVGYRDAHTYRTMLGAPYSGNLDAEAVEVETEEPIVEVTEDATIEPTATPTLEPTLAPEETEAISAPDETEVVAPVEDATEDLDAIAPDETEAVEPTATDDVPEETVAPTNTEIPPTATTEPTETPVPSNTPQPMVTVQYGIVNSEGAVNLRPDPSTDNPPVGVLRSGDRVLIIGENEDGTWYQILTETDSLEGWIAQFLLDIEVELVPPDQAPTSASPKRLPSRLQDDEEATEEPAPDQDLGNAEIDDDISATLTAVSDFDDDISATLTAVSDFDPDLAATLTALPDTELTAEVDFDGQSLVGAPIVVFEDSDNEYRDERWYSMTAGILGAAAIIAFGTIINLFRAIGRRRRGE